MVIYQYKKYLYEKKAMLLIDDNQSQTLKAESFFNLIIFNQK